MIALLVGLACDDPCRPGPEPTFELGAGADRFVPIDMAAPLPLVYGPQGGYHIDLAFRFTHLEGRELLGGTITGRVEGRTAFDAEPWFTARCEEDALVATGIRLFLREELESVTGRDLTVEARVMDARGITVEARAASVVGEAP